VRGYLKGEAEMTVDERLILLLQSTKALHAKVLQMSGQIQKPSDQVQDHTKRLQEQTKQREVDTAYIRSLADIAAAH
jgi:hypothetical protein